RKIVFIDEQTHQFGDGNGWVGIVHLNREGAVEVRERAVLMLLNRKNMLQGARYKEELLLEPELLTLNLFVIGVENLGDILRGYFIRDRTEEVSGVEGFETERFDSLRGPQTHCVRCIGSVTKNRSVMWNSSDHHFGNPAYTIFSVHIGEAL